MFLPPKEKAGGVEVAAEAPESEGLGVTPKEKVDGVGCEVADNAEGWTPKENPPEVEAGCEVAAEEVGGAANENVGAADGAADIVAAVDPSAKPPVDVAGAVKPENPAKGFGPLSVALPSYVGRITEQNISMAA